VSVRPGILTGGGDCPGLIALIRAAVLHAIRTHQGQMLDTARVFFG
jgi:6-phosphofructokinase